MATFIELNLSPAPIKNQLFKKSYMQFTSMYIYPKTTSLAGLAPTASILNSMEK
jgi:hypothetical protein